MSGSALTRVRACVLIPTYDNPDTIRDVVLSARKFVDDVIVVDDHSGPEGEAACQSLADEGLAIVERRSLNGGKGAAVKTGFRVAVARGFTHCLQVDADGQHDLERIPAFLALAEENFGAAVLGYAEYDESAPALRMSARKITKFWVDLETGRDTIEDAMVGFRVYPLPISSALGVRGNRMDFDVEIAIRLAWAGVPIVNAPVRVRYMTAEEGGTSHFQPFRDNVRLGWMHSRLCTVACTKWCLRKLGLIR